MRDEDIPCEMSEATKQRWQEKMKRKGGRFVKGPIPQPWLASAAALPGKALAVGIAIWYRSGIEKSKESIKICPTALEQFNLKARTGRRGLAELEKAGLVSVVRHRGRCPRVTLLVKAAK